jgi:hypothetical protein
MRGILWASLCFPIPPCTRAALIPPLEFYPASCGDATLVTPCAPTTWYDPQSGRDTEHGAPSCCAPCAPGSATNTGTGRGGTACNTCPVGQFSVTSRESCRSALPLEPSPTTDTSYGWHQFAWVAAARERREDVAWAFLLPWYVVFGWTMAAMVVHALSDLHGWVRTRKLATKDAAAVPTHLMA